MPIIFEEPAAVKAGVISEGERVRFGFHKFRHALGISYSQSTEPNPYGPGHSAPIPAYCRVEGVINRRSEVGGEEFGINFALAMPANWNSDFLMQGGGGGNGIVMAPLGLNAAGETPGLMRGFAVVSTDTGHKSHSGPFDFGFMKDEQAYLDFAYLANVQVATLAKQLIAQYYGKSAAHSYFSPK